MDNLNTEIARERLGDDEAFAPFYAAGGGVLRTTYEAELVRLARQYTAFAGSTRNALNLISGLRKAGPITLQGCDDEATFTPPTAPMGWSRVQRILNLARAGLASLGIHHPQPSEIMAALVGGTLSVGGGMVAFPGVLRMYGDRLDWTRIAHAFALAAPAASLQQVEHR